MKLRFFVIAYILASFSLTAYAGEKTHWGYSGHGGPEHWGELDPSFSLCSAGKNQSPINLTGFIKGKLKPISFNYATGGNEILNNGHTIQVNYMPGSSIIVDDRSFELKQFHFHTPSENTIEGQSYPLEAHFVHADKNGNLAVLAVWYKEGRQNQELKKAWDHMPLHAGKKYALPTSLDALAMLPDQHGYYRFNGSLTTPPCSEGVRWLVMKYYDTVSKEQIEKFTKAMHGPTNRPVQPINARIIVK